MTFTAREDYGLRAVLDIAANAARGPVQARDIAHRQGIPEQFLEQLLGALRRAEVIRSIRGAGGGYVLAGEPYSLHVGDILRALSGPLVPPELSAANANDSPETSAVRLLWGELCESLSSVADGTSLAALLERCPEGADASYAMHI
jgi:Rrf2 family protein